MDTKIMSNGSLQGTIKIFAYIDRIIEQQVLATISRKLMNALSTN